MPKHCVSGLCNKTNKDGYSTDTWPKYSKVARKWDRFVKLDEANGNHGNPSDVLCGGHFRQPDDFISYDHWRHQFSFHAYTQGKRPSIDLLVEQKSSSRPTATRANDHDDDFNNTITTKTHSNHSCFQFDTRLHYLDT